MPVFKVMVPFSDCGEIATCDAIEHQGKIWLVPMWLDFPSTQERKPLRIVHLGPFGLKPLSSAGCQYVAEVMLLSKSVLEGRVQPSPPIVVVESPEISFPIPTSSH